MNYYFKWIGRYFFYLCMVTTLMSMVYCQSSRGSSDEADTIVKAVDSVKNKFVPDRRTQIFDYNLSKEDNHLRGRTSNSEAYKAIKKIVVTFPELNTDSFLLIRPLQSAVINVSVGNIRSEPGHSNELSTQALMGQVVKIWDRSGSWYYIQTPDGYLGWTDGGAVVVKGPDEMDIYVQAPKMMYTADFGFCYREPDANGPVISDLTAGNILRFVKNTGSMTEVLLPDGRRAYISKDSSIPLDLPEFDQIPDWESIEKVALRFTGRPYLWGGTSGKGVDCSGFTKMVYYLNGLELPRDASQQVRKGVEIPVDDRLTQLVPGDFLFFGNKGTEGGPDKVTHVAIYMGGGKMIHSSERVQIQSLFPEDPDYVPERKNTLLTVKRMISMDHFETDLRKIKTDPAYGF